MQPLQYDLRCPAAKENSITHTAAAPTNLDAAIAMRFAKTELQNTIRHQKLQLQNRPRRQRKKNDFEALFKPYHRQFHCDLRSRPCKSHYNVDQGGNPQRCSRYNAICTPELYRRGSQHRREPLCARKQKVSWDS